LLAKLDECSLALAYKILVTARMLGFSFKCAQLLEFCESFGFGLVW